MNEKRTLQSCVFKTVWLFDVVFTAKTIDLIVGAWDSFMNAFQFDKHTANIKRKGLNDGNFNAGDVLFITAVILKERLNLQIEVYGLVNL